MRRNIPNRRGAMGNSGNPGGGPLMTEHLKDIDLELELLKRKRDMIEQQQHLLAMEQQFQSSSRHFDFEPHGSNRDFAHLYDNGSKNRGQFGRKRQPEPQWQYENPSKRTTPKRKGPQPQFNPRMGQVPPRPIIAGPPNFRNPRPILDPSIGQKNFPRGAVPLMSIKVKQSVSQRIANQNMAPRPNAPRKQITQNKVTKPKPAPAPNKLAAQPIAERKKLVAAATQAGAQASAQAGAQADVTRMLLPDQVPTQQVSGRLELALGAIMKNIRESVIKDSPHAAMLRSVEIQRVMKQAVRERIKTVMLGKVVGSMLEILGFYREEFPPETDVDIVNIALEAIGVIPSNKEPKKNVIESDNPEHFFKMNMCYLLESRLTEMFKKLEEIYGAENPDAGEVELKTWNVKDSLPESQEDSEEFKQFLDSNIKARDVRRYLPRLMKKNLPYIIKLLNMDTTYQSNKAAITMMANQKAGQPVSDEKPAVEVSIPSPIRTPVYTLPFYVKIMGRPSLPKKKVMQTFLTQFNPKSVKKHRTIHNLLFIGLAEKSDQDAILAADGTVIGRISLSVRICGKGNENSSNDQSKDIDFSLDISQSDLKNESADSDIIGADLDGQITDLLSSIRKETDDDTTGQSTDNKEQVAKQTISEEIDESKNDIVMKELDDENDSKTAETAETIPEEESNAEKVDQPENVQESTDKAEAQNTESATSEKVDEEIPSATENKSEESMETESKTDESKVTESKTEEIKETENKTDESKDTEAKTKETNGVKPSEQSNAKEDTPVIPADEENKTQQPKDETKSTETDTKPAEAEPAKVAETKKDDETKDLPVEQVENDRVEELKSNGSGRSTPTRTSARKANANVTPSSIRTRRASRLVQN